jgi:hypothetical protein
MNRDLPAPNCRGQEVGFYLIVSSRGLYDCLIDLDEFFGIARPIVPVNVADLEFI